MQTTELGGGRGWLDAAAAASVHRLDRALGHLMQTTETGRTWAQQNVHWQKYLRDGYPIALKPGTSVHERGNAIDTDEGQRHVDLLARHGWKQTVYRNGKLVEPWHFEYTAANDQHRNDPAPSTPESEEDDDMATEPLPLLIKLDPGRYWVVANMEKQTFFKVRNDTQRDFYKNTNRADEVQGAQPAAVIAGFTETNA